VTGSPATATVNYAKTSATIRMTVSGILGTTGGAFTITNGSYTASYTQNTVGGAQDIDVPAAGTYTITSATPQTLDGLEYTVAVGTPSVTVNVGTTPTAANIAFTNTTNRVRTNLSGFVAGQTPVTLSCTGGTAVGPITLNQSATQPQVHVAGNNTTCTVTAPAWVNPTTGLTHVAAVVNNNVAPTTGAIAPQITIVYAAVQPRITINMQSVGTGTNNLPNGIAFTVRVSSSAYSATGGFKDFQGVTGTPLAIDVPSNNTYNVSINNSLTLTSQQWQVAAVGDVTTAGGSTVGTPALVAPNVVVSNIILGPSATPAVTDFQSIINIKWTGPLP